MSSKNGDLPVFLNKLTINVSDANLVTCIVSGGKKKKDQNCRNTFQGHICLAKAGTSHTGTKKLIKAAAVFMTNDRVTAQKADELRAEFLDRAMRVDVAGRQRQTLWKNDDTREHLLAGVHMRRG